MSEFHQLHIKLHYKVLSFALPPPFLSSFPFSPPSSSLSITIFPYPFLVSLSMFSFRSIFPLFVLSSPVFFFPLLSPSHFSLIPLSLLSSPPLLSLFILSFSKKDLSKKIPLVFFFPLSFLLSFLSYLPSLFTYFPSPILCLFPSHFPCHIYSS